MKNLCVSVTSTRWYTTTTRHIQSVEATWILILNTCFGAVLWNKGLVLLGSEHLYLDLLLIRNKRNVWSDEIIQHIFFLQVTVTIVQRLVSVLQPRIFWPFSFLLEWNVSDVIIIEVATTYSHVTVWSVVLLSQDELSRVLYKTFSYRWNFRISLVCLP